jgi:hypothetical protein
MSPSINIRHRADGAIGTAMKSCIHKHPTHPDQRSLKPEIVFQKEQTSVINTVYGRWKNLSAVFLTPVNSLFIAVVVDTAERFIVGVNDTGDNICPRCH